jgi:Protein of unknown function (DUF2917)
MRTTTETVRTIDLGHDQMMVFDGGRNGRVRVLFGATWLTQEDEPGDAILHAGSELALSGGRTVIEALGSTRLQIVERTGVAALLAAFLRQVWRSVRQHITRLQIGPVVVHRGA